MSNSKFIDVPSAVGNQIVAVDNIARVESWGGGGSKITLKEVKNGSNVEIISSSAQSEILMRINIANTIK